jgi:sec-independent protein translocase protein TatA
MFGLGTQELLIILLIAFFIFGGKRLPELGKSLGTSIRGFKKAMEEPTTGEPGETKQLPPGDKK